LIHNLDLEARALYDLKSDPGEHKDLLDGTPAPPRLEEPLRKYIDQGAPAEQHEGELDSKTLEQLRQLGYIE
jgi:hypothetical protein